VEKGESPSKGKVSLTDRDARMVKDKDSIYMGYNCQTAVDKENHVIVSAEVFNEASDRGLLQPMIEEVKVQTEKDLGHTDIGFDSGYFSSDNISYSHKHDLDVYLPEGKGEGGVRQWQGDLIRGRDCQTSDVPRRPGHGDHRGQRRPG